MATSPNPTAIAVMLHRGYERAAVERGLAGRPYVSCANAHELGEAIASGNVIGAITELRDSAGLEVVGYCPREKTSVPFLVVCPLTSAASTDLLRLVAAGLNVSVVLRGFDDIERAVQGLISEGVYPDAKARILAALSGRIAPSIREIVVGGVVVGSRRCRVGVFAAACGMSFRTLERRLANAAWPPGYHLLGSILCLHSLWRLEELEWSTKRVAAAAGFHNADVFANYVARHSRMRLRALKRLGFTEFLESFVTLVTRVGK